MKTVLIPVETKAREFLSKVWLSYNIVSDDINVVLGDKRIVLKKIHDIDPDFYLSLGASEGRESLFNKIDSSTLIGVLDTEGAVLRSEHSVSDRYSAKAINNTDIYYSWGSNQSSEIRTEFKTQVLTTGNPRFDLLHENFRNLYSNSKHTQQLDEFVLFITNFTSVNPYYGTQKTNATSDLIEWQRAMIKNYQQVIIEVSKNINKPIIVRPHPGEGNKKYKQMFKHYSNIHVIYEGSARYFIKKAAVVIHSGSTVGIEANMMDTPVIGFNPETWYSPSRLPMLASYQVENCSDLVEEVREVLKTDLNDYDINPELPEEVKNKIHNFDKPISANLISNSIQKILKSKNVNSNNKNNEKRMSREYIKMIPYTKRSTKIIKNNQGFFNIIDRILPGNQPTLSGQRFKMFPGTSEEEINSVITKFDDSANISVERVGKWSDLYRLTKNK
jgi:surface carbohydrate biosynthesis protein